MFTAALDLSLLSHAFDCYAAALSLRLPLLALLPYAACRALRYAPLRYAARRFAIFVDGYDCADATAAARRFDCVYFALRAARPSPVIRVFAHALRAYRYAQRAAIMRVCFMRRCAICAPDEHAIAIPFNTCFVTRLITPTFFCSADATLCRQLLARFSSLDCLMPHFDLDISPRAISPASRLRHAAMMIDCRSLIPRRHARHTRPRCIAAYVAMRAAASVIFCLLC